MLKMFHFWNIKASQVSCFQTVHVYKLSTVCRTCFFMYCVCHFPLFDSKFKSVAKMMWVRNCIVLERILILQILHFDIFNVFHKFTNPWNLIFPSMWLFVFLSCFVLLLLCSGIILFVLHHFARFHFIWLCSVSFALFCNVLRWFAFICLI